MSQLLSNNNLLHKNVRVGYYIILILVSLFTFIWLLTISSRFLLIDHYGEGHQNFTKSSVKKNKKQSNSRMAPLVAPSLETRQDREFLMLMDFTTNYTFQKQAFPELYQLHPEPVPKKSLPNDDDDKQNVFSSLLVVEICEPFSVFSKRDDNNKSRRRARKRRKEFCQNLAVVDSRKSLVFKLKFHDPMNGDSNNEKNVQNCLEKERETIKHVTGKLSETEQGKCFLDVFDHDDEGIDFGKDDQKHFFDRSHHFHDANTTSSPPLIIIGFHLTKNRNKMHKQRNQPMFEESALAKHFLPSLVNSMNCNQKENEAEEKPQNNNNNNVSNYQLHLIFDDDLEIEAASKYIFGETARHHPLQKSCATSHQTSVIIKLIHTKDIINDSNSSHLLVTTATNQRAYFLFLYLKQIKSMSSGSFNQIGNTQILLVDTRDAIFQGGGEGGKSVFGKIADEFRQFFHLQNHNDFIFTSSEIFPLASATHTRMWMENLFSASSTVMSPAAEEAFRLLLLHRSPNSTSAIPNHHRHQDFYRLLPDGSLLPVLNSGIIGGNLLGMIRLFSWMTKIIDCLVLLRRESKQNEIYNNFGLDQGIFNFIAYYGMFRERYNNENNKSKSFDFFVFDHKTGPIVNYVRNPRKDIILANRNKDDELNVFANCFGKPYSIIHQLDRHN